MTVIQDTVRSEALASEAAKDRKLKRESLKITKQNSDLALKEAGYENVGGKLTQVEGGAADIQDEINSETMNLIKSQQQETTRRDTDKALVDFTKTGDLSILQTTFENNSHLKETWAKAGIEQMMPIDFENDSELLMKAGLKPEMYATPEQRTAINKSGFKTYGNGTWDFTLAEDMAAKTGAYKRLAKTDRQVFRDNLIELTNALKGKSSELETRKVVVEEQKAKTAAETLAYQKDKFEAGGTAKQKDIIKSREHQDTMINDFGGEDEFFATDFSEPKNFNKAYNNVIAIEKLEGTTFTNPERKELNDLRQLISLGDPAIKLTSSQTGILDSALKSVKQYVSDEVGGVRAKAAYTTFRNILRNNLFGSQLTEAEIKAHKESFGALGQKRGPVLTKFKLHLEQVMEKLNSISSMQNPYTAHVRLGVDKEKLSNIITAVGQSIDMLSGKPTDKPERPPLSSFYIGAK